jgi:hypothetical protein
MTDCIFNHSFLLRNSNTHFANATTTCFLLPSANNHGHGDETAVPIYFFLGAAGFVLGRCRDFSGPGHHSTRLHIFPYEQSLVVQPPKTASSSAPPLPSPSFLWELLLVSRPRSSNVG